MYERLSLTPRLVSHRFEKESFRSRFATPELKVVDLRFGAHDLDAGIWGVIAWSGHGCEKL